MTKNLTFQDAFRFTALAGIFLLGACASSRSLDESVNDLAASTELKAALFTDREYDYADIDMTLFEGTLLLTGTMRTPDGRDKLLKNAQKADGVKSVISEVLIEEKTNFVQGLKDTRIDQTLRANLLADGEVKSVRYKIAVSKGVVYLLGEARSQAELNKASAIARRINGVKDVVAHVAIVPPGTPR